MGIEQDLRAAWDIEPLRGLWQRAREALEAPDKPSTFRLELPDDESRSAVGELYGRPLWGQGTRINVAKLDSAVQNTRFGLSLSEVLEILHGTPVRRAESAESAAQQRYAHCRDTVRAALAAQGLAETAWAEPWCEWLCQFGRIPAAELPTVARQAAGVLAEISTPDPDRPWTSRAELASRHGGPHLLDEGTALSRVVLRAAAFAYDVEPPTNARERQVLWERCRVALDAVTDSALCWAMPWAGSDVWSRTGRERNDLRLATHLTLADLRATSERLVNTGTVIAVCESPRVLEAATLAGIHHPLICTRGYSSSATRELLRRLLDDGAVVYCHADFDWSGLDLARALREQGARLWRLTSADYREALDRASAERLDLPVLAGEPIRTPWDPELSTLLATAGRAVEEEMLLTSLLDDLRSGLR